MRKFSAEDFENANIEKAPKSRFSEADFEENKEPSLSEILKSVLSGIARPQIEMGGNVFQGANKLAHNLVNSVPTIATSLANATNPLAPYASNPIPKIPMQTRNADLGLQNNFGNQLSQDIISNIPATLMPGLKATALEPILGKLLASSAGRIAPQVALGSVTGSDNPFQNAQRAAIGQTAAETLPFAFKGMGKLAEQILPKNYTAKAIEFIKHNYDKGITDLKDLYDSVLNKYGKNEITARPKNYFSFKEKEIKNFTPNVEEAYDIFQKSPTFNNAHKLQAEMFKSANPYKHEPGLSEQEQYQSLMNARNKVKEKLNNFLGKDQKAQNTYWRAGEMMKNDISHYTSTPTLEKISHGKGEYLNLEPEDLRNQLNMVMANASKDINMKAHPLHRILDELSHQIHKGNFWKGFAPEQLRKWMPNITGATQNPYGVSLAKKTGNKYDKIKNALIANLINFGQ